MAKTTPDNPTPRGRRLGDAVPQLPVVKKEEAPAEFFIIREPSTFQGRYGLSWRVTCADVGSGEQFLMLLQSNAVRDDVMAEIQRAFAGSDTPFGPLTFTKRRLANGHETWEIVDATEPADAPDA